MEESGVEQLNSVSDLIPDVASEHGSQNFEGLEVVLEYLMEQVTKDELKPFQPFQLQPEQAPDMQPQEPSDMQPQESPQVQPTTQPQEPSVPQEMKPQQQQPQVELKQYTLLLPMKQHQQGQQNSEQGSNQEAYDNLRTPLSLNSYDSSIVVLDPNVVAPDYNIDSDESTASQWSLGRDATKLMVQRQSKKCQK